MFDMTNKCKGLKNADTPAYDAGLVKRAPLQLKITQIGNSLGVILPKELLAKLDVEKGDTLIATAADGGLRLTVFDPEFEQQMAAARRVMKSRRAVLRELAK
jgi:putative addiction module antidote